MDVGAARKLATEPRIQLDGGGSWQRAVLDRDAVRPDETASICLNEAASCVWRAHGAVAAAGVDRRWIAFAMAHLAVAACFQSRARTNQAASTLGGRAVLLLLFLRCIRHSGRVTLASTVGVLPRPMSSARQPPRPAESQNWSQAKASRW